jgi:hypothetical protein
LDTWFVGLAVGPDAEAVGEMDTDEDAALDEEMPHFPNPLWQPVPQ